MADVILADARAWPLRDGMAQLVATDPPYNCAMPYDAHDDAMPWPAYWAMLEAMTQEAYRCLRPGGVLAVMLPTHGYDKVTTDRKVSRSQGWRNKQPRVERRRVGPGIRMASRYEEMVERAGFLYEATLSIVHSFQGEGTAFAIGTGIGGASRPNFRMASRSLIIAFKEVSRVPGRSGKWGELPLDWCKTAWHVPPAWAGKNRRVNHPCPQPYEVPARVIQLYSNPGDLVVDPFAGAGTTLRAAQTLGRRAVGWDVSLGYCQVARRQLAQGALAL